MNTKFYYVKNFGTRINIKLLTDIFVRSLGFHF